LSFPSVQQCFVIGVIETAAGKVPQVSATLLPKDRWGHIRARWGVGRMSYTVEAGLYALGEPTPESPVVVTANYKMSFDVLRSSLPGRDAWILVLDTRGINVWCAAGKGTFGTDELVQRLESSGVSRLTSQRTLILPQLAAPGVAAHEVLRLSGFRVVYGPVRARDLPLFLDRGLKAEPRMRQVTFLLSERAAVIPVELVSALKWSLILAPILFVLGGLKNTGSFWESSLDHGMLGVTALLAAILAGSILTPLLLPWLPGRAFALKGLFVGLVLALLLSLLRRADLTNWHGRFEVMALVLTIPALSAYLAMNFTGASSFTSLSGVKKEVRWTLPGAIAGIVFGLGCWVASWWAG